MNKDLKELKDDFALFDDWEERYRYMIDLGRNIPEMDEALKVDANLVRGCTSRVWLYPTITDDNFTFVADSDAHIVRGLISLLYAAYNNKTRAQILDVNIEAAFKEMGMDQHLSPSRRNGFFSMVERIRSLATNPALEDHSLQA